MRRVVEAECEYLNATTEHLKCKWEATHLVYVRGVSVEALCQQHAVITKRSNPEIIIVKNEEAR